MLHSSYVVFTKSYCTHRLFNLFNRWWRLKRPSLFVWAYTHTIWWHCLVFSVVCHSANAQQIFHLFRRWRHWYLAAIPRLVESVTQIPRHVVMARCYSWCLPSIDHW